MILAVFLKSSNNPTENVKKYTAFLNRPLVREDRKAVSSSETSSSEPKPALVADAIKRNGAFSKYQVNF